MTNKEIEKILSFLNNEQLERLKKYLLSEKVKNNSILRQKTFEKYLTNNIFGLNGLTLPSIYNDKKENVQIFTNFASIYILNKNFLSMESDNLSFERNRTRKTSHRFKLASKEEMNEYVSIFEKNLACKGYDILSIGGSCRSTSSYYDVQYLDELEQKLNSELFRSNEIDIADIILNNPKYTIYNDKKPILKAESEIGKCYILGCKNK